MAACENPNVVWDQKPSPGYPGRKQQVPCGTCILCRVEQTRQNAVLILHEAKQHEEACMATFTYNDEELPTNGSLDYRDLQLMWKRLRKAGHQFRYFAVGEYGEQTNRPHYHACIFGKAWKDDQIIVKTDPLEWISPELDKAWGLGACRINPLSFTTAAYAASYVQKKLGENKPYVNLDKETGEIIYLKQPRSIRSESLGKTWWTKYHQQQIDHDHVIINGRIQKPPKRYDNWLKETQPETIQKIKKERKKIAIQNKKTPQQLHARAKNAHARTKQNKKSL
jgi:hypothetical protein